MNFRQIEAFRALMVSGTASQAAELLKVSQPAISKTIAELERDLGFALFSRTRSRLVPTPEAHLFYREASDVYAKIELLRATAVRIRDIGSGEIRVASLPALGDTLVPRALRLFKRESAKTMVTLRVAGSATVRELVASGQYNLGLVAEEVDTVGIERQPFAKYAAVCVMAPGHKLSKHKTVTAHDLDGCDFILPSPEDNSRRRIDTCLAECGAKPITIAEAYSSATICSLALEGIGVGIVNPLAASGYVSRGLVVKPFSPKIGLTVHLIFPAEGVRSPLVRTFVKALAAARNELAG